MKQVLPGYEFLKLIGKGSFGQVYCARNNNNNELCAIKVIPLENINPRLLNYLDREIKMLRSVSHKNITKLVDALDNSQYRFLIFEYCNGGDLANYLKSKGGKLDELTARHIIRQVAKAMNQLNSLSIIHRDIKLANIFLHFPDIASKNNSRPIVKLGDFGFARELTVGDILVPPETSIEMSNIGSPLYMAPEVIYSQAYNFSADIWSLGSVLYQLVCGEACFSGSDKTTLQHNIKNGSYKIKKSLGLSWECMSLISECLLENSCLRINCKSLLSHPFLKQEVHSSIVKNAKVWQHEDSENYIFTTKREDNEKISKSALCWNGHEMMLSEAEYGFLKIDKIEENNEESGFLLI